MLISLHVGGGNQRLGCERLRWPRQQGQCSLNVHCKKAEVDGQVRAHHGKTPRSQDSGNSWDAEGEELVSERSCFTGPVICEQTKLLGAEPLEEGEANQ